MANILEAFGTNGQAITVTLASLASGGARQSVSIDNTSNLYDDYLVMLKLKTGAGATAAPKVVNLYVGGTVDNGTTWTESAANGSGATTDAGITLTAPTNMRFLGQISAVASATSYIGGPFSVAQAFGGVVPAKWFLVVENQTGTAFDTTAADANFTKLYQGVFYTVV